jgi:hypothetical protein
MCHFHKIFSFLIFPFSNFSRRSQQAKRVHPLDISTAAPCFRLLKGISFNGLSPFVAAKGQENKFSVPHGDGLVQEFHLLPRITRLLYHGGFKISTHLCDLF